MLSLARRIHRSHPCLLLTTRQFQSARTDSSSRPPPRRRSKHAANLMLKKTDDKSEWWVVDGEMHEIGENVPPRERFIIPRQNLPNKRRKQLREQFMRRTRLVLKESEHEPWCKRYMELYNETRENWERLYWDEGYSKKLAQDHANYDSAEEDDEDFNPNRRRPQFAEPMKEGGFVRNRQGGPWEKEGGFVRNRQGGGGGTWEKEGGMGRNREGGGERWEKVSLIRDKFEYDRERRMREKAFAPMNERNDFVKDDSVSKLQPFDPHSYLSDDSDSDSD